MGPDTPILVPNLHMMCQPETHKCHKPQTSSENLVHTKPRFTPGQSPAGTSQHFTGCTSPCLLPPSTCRGMHSLSIGTCTKKKKKEDLSYLCFTPSSRELMCTLGT